MVDRRWQPASYEEMVAGFRWEVPDRYNIAADCLDKHPDDVLAMVDGKPSPRVVSSD